MFRTRCDGTVDVDRSSMRCCEILAGK